MSSLVRLLTDPEFLITIMVAVAAFATIITLAMPWLQRDRLNSRLKLVANQREELRRKSREALNNKNEPAKLRDNSAGFMKDVVDRFNLRNMLESKEIKMKLMQAGFRGQRPVVAFVFFRLVAPPVMFGVFMLYLFLVNDFGLKSQQIFMFSILGGFLGYYLPNMFVQNVAQKRQQSIMSAFPDALDLMLICVESGMSVEVAFNKVSNEIGGSSIELAEELGLTTAELSYLQERRQAYENLADRTGHPGVKAVCTSLIQAERYGTPVGTALRVMADENRQMRMQFAEKKAASLPAKLTVPMIAFFLPVLFVVILGPAAIQLFSN
ncbi:MAG: type II secretion system F family protein [Alphaproteobacteria bacterium]|nr:MAG: type II secretion system F family protein [Alphaproteobacteria bacterium]